VVAVASLWGVAFVLSVAIWPPYVCAVPSCKCVTQLERQIMSGKTYHVGVINVEDLTPGSSNVRRSNQRAS
jgi:hypothetical protein